MSLPRWFPRPVPMAIGGAVYQVSELRIRDREDLLAYVATVAGPIEAALDPAAPDYAQRLEAAYDGGEGAWPPPLGSAMANAILYEHPDGLAFFLLLALREHPGITLADAGAMAEAMAEGEFTAVYRVAWAIRDDPKAAVLKLIDRHLGLPEFEPAAAISTAGEPITWDQAVGELVATPGKALAWATPDAVGDLTLSQWRLVRSGGEPDDDGDALPADPELRERVEKARRAFFRIPESAPAEDAPQPPVENVDMDAVGEWSSPW